MKPEVTEHHPLLATREGMAESQIEMLQEEIREEAYRIYVQHLSAGKCCSPQDDWMEARATVLARHSDQPVPPGGARFTR